MTDTSQPDDLPRSWPSRWQMLNPAVQLALVILGLLIAIPIAFEPETSSPLLLIVVALYGLHIVLQKAIKAYKGD